MRKYRYKPKKYKSPLSLHENVEFAGNRMLLVPEPKKDQITFAALAELEKLKAAVGEGCKTLEVERAGFTCVRVCKCCGKIFERHIIILDYDDFCCRCKGRGLQ